METIFGKVKINWMDRSEEYKKDEYIFTPLPSGRYKKG